MPDSLLLDGVDDYRAFSAGSLAGSGAISFAVIVKKATDSSWQNLNGWNALDAACFISDANNLVFGDGTTFALSAFTVLVSEGWVLLGATKTSGTTVPRFHKYVYNTSTWTHSDAFAGQTIPNLPALSAYRVGINPSGFQAFPGNILIDAAWDSVISDATFETMEFSKQAWADASPDEARRYDTIGEIIPFVGTSVEQTSIGGTLDTGDAPAGWNDDTGPPPQQIRPDADITTTGWTTAPLWSKVNDSSDSTVISSTAS
jgi:hypothetical protein